MKKKIKKLSLIELHRLCSNTKCSVCPLRISENCLCVVDYIGSGTFDYNCKSVLDKRIKL